MCLDGTEPRVNMGFRSTEDLGSVGTVKRRIFLLLEQPVGVGRACKITARSATLFLGHGTHGRWDKHLFRLDGLYLYGSNGISRTIGAGYSSVILS